MTDTLNTVDVVNLLTAHRGARFAGFRYTAKGSGEVSKVVVILGASLEALYRRDIDVLTEMLEITPETDLEFEAATALLLSRRESLANGIGNNSRYVHGPLAADTYQHIDGLPGIKIHRETGEVYVTGLVHHKEVIEPGTYKPVKSRPLTIAKRNIEKWLPSGRFRQYSLPALTRVAANGETLEMA